MGEPCHDATMTKGSSSASAGLVFSLHDFALLILVHARGMCRERERGFGALEPIHIPYTDVSELLVN